MDNCTVCNILRLVGECRYPLTAARTTASVIVLAWPTEAIGTALVLARRHATTMDDALMRRCLERDTDLVKEAILAAFEPLDIVVDRAVGRLHGHTHLVPVYRNKKNGAGEKPACCSEAAPSDKLVDKQRLYDALAVFRVSLAKTARLWGRDDLHVDLLQESTFPLPAP